MTIYEFYENELESSMMSEHVVEREIKEDFFGDDHNSPVTSE